MGVDFFQARGWGYVSFTASVKTILRDVAGTLRPEAEALMYSLNCRRSSTMAAEQIKMGLSYAAQPECLS